ncbi:pirin family protein [Geobacter pelophilus]|jgi:redox-sensitive bicupin YhaK (pirin superfamily)|uniref:Pirin family protein n=1 Tax=Geoanaerobacter pelophilus TaxID=60036 RepID=A0AAW4L6H1_9BACT|nr:pirin family protein [Geoanaerobacter pelophilus]MBT0666586.1 pirin family protein [Geoanaerobacter pelophilus]
MATRLIDKIFKSRPTIEGAGVHLKRAFGYSQVPLFDPFLMLDDFHTANPAEYLAGFPWHPHRGIETITYVLEGLVEHGDSMGNKGVIGSGDVQWMTAGSGIIHQEMPQKSPTGIMWGFQFWANLPAAQKMMAPRYRDVKAADIPEVVLDSGVKIKVVSGRINGTQGPVQDIVIDPEMLDVSVPPGTVYRHQVKTGHTAIAYLLAGEGYFDERRDPFAIEMAGAGWMDVARRCICGPETVVLYEREGEEVCITAGEKGVRFLFISGKPLGEPVAWYGPIVMNSQEELRIAFEEYEKGTFIKKK